MSPASRMNRGRVERADGARRVGDPNRRRALQSSLSAWRCVAVEGHAACRREPDARS